MIYFDLENENGFFCLFFFLLSSYIYARKTNQQLCVKDDKWKFLYKNGLSDYFNLDSRIVKYNLSDKVSGMYGHMREPPMNHSLHDYKLYSKELYNVRSDILYDYQMPDKYNSIFIRGGDKLLYEATQIPISTYVSCLLDLSSDITNVFIHSDDNKLVESVEQYIADKYLNLNVYKITTSKHNGGAVIMKRLRYGQCKDIVSVDEMTRNEVKDHTVLMLNAIEIMKKSQNVIVSYDSNVSRFLQLYFDCNVYSVAHPNELNYNVPVKNPAYSF